MDDVQNLGGQGFSSSFEAIGTHWQIDIPEDRTSGAYDLLFQEIQRRIETFDRHYSRFRDDSLIAEMARRAGAYSLPDDAAPLLDLYEKLYCLTDGAFTPLIGSVMEEAGYGADYSLKPRTLHAPPRWDEAMEYCFPRLTMKRPTLLDFGAAGKGHLIDLAGQLLQKNGIQAYTIDVGGDILHRGGNHLRVGLEHPENPQQVIGVHELKEGSICCSAGNRRAWGNFHHIIDPRTLTSPRHILSVWVSARAAMVADALATCLFLVSPEVLRHSFDFEYGIMYADHSFAQSEGFEAEVFTQ
ncbi:hypothetical protein A3J43_01780 [Candidatus Uhrbacteria bacterium RIFCSPHIGHO2_12_FULL_54_23]|uniref:FAD:protein FMN transferase n=1 Tax=Candidatus Uhrbacteria bacterium RIFCSPHIGHO2_12_FULL_54_23 TaxID=1802397 RepID=A0A1F7UKA8_9BACT|nr:MAG: hypothetical protein A3J43_01780 [Candidatus Uhrbacteria bacterium RIFCSPHIGHO2_12_FULL_54_23]